MNTKNTITIQGPIDRVFELAAKVEDWPKLLPHYRQVEVLKEDGDGRMVAMRCVRPFGPIGWPCRWSARQQIRRDECRIIYKHLSGPANGMAVEWELEPKEAGVLATISHHLVHPLGRVYTDQVVGPIFVSAIADLTLRTMKSLIEAEEIQ